MTTLVQKRLAQIRRGIVPAGYKKTRKVIIPEQWEVRTIGDIATVSSGSTPNRAESRYWHGNIPWVTTGELAAGLVTSVGEHLTEAALEETKLKVYPAGTLLMAMYGQGKTRGTTAILGIDATINQACAAIRPKEGIGKYLFYVLQASYDNIRRLSNVGNQENLSGEIINAYPIVWPSPKEQRKIANILATQDKILDLWNQKIDQMRLLKTLCLRKMFPLAGREVPEVRFSGFSGTWNWRKVKDVFNLLQNTPLPRSELSETHGIVGNIHYGDILTKFPEDLDLSRESLPFIRDNNIASRYSASLLQEGDVIMADTAEDELVGKCCEVNGITTQKVLAGLHTIPLRPIIHFVPRYLGYYMNTPSFHRQLIPLMQGIKVTSLAKHSLLRTNISFPKSRREQSKISQFFHVVDSIIALCQRRRDAEEQKKKALMQLLLTGVVRV